MGKKIIAFALMALMLLSVVPVSSFAANDIISSRVEDNNGVVWSYNMFGSWTFEFDGQSGINGSQYRVKTGYDWPRNATGIYNEVYSFDLYSYSWTRMSSGQGMYGQIVDENGYIWENNSGRYLFHDPDNFMQAFEASMYTAITGANYPTTGKASGSETTCYYNRINNTWSTNPGGFPGGGFPGGGIGDQELYYLLQNATALVYDTNGVTWYQVAIPGMSFTTWYFYADGQIGDSSKYTQTTGKSLPSFGQGYYTANQGTMMYFYFNGYAWVEYEGGGFPGGGFPGGGFPGGDMNYYYLMQNATAVVYDENNVTWYGIGTTGTSYLSWYYVVGTTVGSYSDYKANTGNDLPMQGIGYYKNSTSSATNFYFNGYGWSEYSGGSGFPDFPVNPGNPGGGISSGLLSDPNKASAVKDTNGYLWQKSGSVWVSTYSNRYSTANPAQYIDNQGRVWKMYPGQSSWLRDDSASGGSGSGNGGGTTTPATDPNSLTTVTDLRGFTWYKSGSTWYSSNSQQYNNVNRPQYRDEAGNIWVLAVGNRTWQSSGSTTDPETPVDPSSGYIQYEFNGRTYNIPITTTVREASPSTLPSVPDGYTWMNINGQYQLARFDTSVIGGYEIYPLPTVYVLPSGYAYYPTGDLDNPWVIKGNGIYPTSVVSSIEFTEYPWKLKPGDTSKVKISYETDDIDNGLNSIIIYSSSDENVATVDQNGVITAVGEGRADITARAFLGIAETTIDIYVEKEDTKPVDPVDPPEPEDTPVYEIFNDISKNLWCVEYIQFVYDNELFKGISATEFGPDEEMTRAMFVTVLSRLAGVDTSKYETSGFTDVDKYMYGEPHWAQEAIAWASSIGLVNGVGEGLFDPEGNVTREQVCAILKRYAENVAKIKIDLPYNVSFADAADIEPYAQDAVSWCDQKGFLSGKLLQNNNFFPGDDATRADVATIITRYVKNYGKN